MYRPCCLPHCADDSVARLVSNAPRPCVCRSRRSTLAGLPRLAVSQDEDTNTTPGDQVDAPVPSPQAKAKRPAEDETAGNESASSEPESAFHHGQELELEGVACVVKLYDYAEGDLKLNDTAEFVGVLGYDDQSLPSHEEEQTGSGDPFQGMEHFSRKVPPPSLAPRLHCICEMASTQSRTSEKQQRRVLPRFKRVVCRVGSPKRCALVHSLGILISQRCIRWFFIALTKEVFRGMGFRF